MNEYLDTAISVTVFAGAIRIGTPMLLAAIGEKVVERAGILNLGIEGTLTVGAFASFVTADRTGSLWAAVVVAALAGLATSMVMGFLTVTVKVEQVVAGLAINLLGIGFSFYLLRALFADGGSGVQSVGTFDRVEVPLLSSIPLLGEVLFRQHWLSYLAVLSIPVVWYVLERTGAGLQLRSVGHNPKASDLRGVHIERVQYAALAFGGVMAGLAGAFLSIFSTGLFFPEIAAGRGWIALALVIFGNWRLWLITVGALFFGYIEAFQLTIQGQGTDLPQQLLLALPYVLTLVALVLNRSNSNIPLHLGRPYFRGQR
ncbi:MAG: ABC transporter permease [Acidimicrobiales bacterium]